jgi:hypothetical protein
VQGLTAAGKPGAIAGCGARPCAETTSLEQGSSLAYTLERRSTMSTTAWLFVIVLVFFFFGGGGYYFYRR